MHQFNLITVQMNNNLNHKQSPIKSNQILGGEVVGGGGWKPKENTLFSGHHCFLDTHSPTSFPLPTSLSFSLFLISHLFPDKGN